MKYSDIFWEVSLFLLLLIESALPEALMCSKCNSNHDRDGADCEKNPPPPIRCFSTSGVNYCMIAKEYNKYDEQINYIRDCSTERKLGESCIDTNVGDTDDPKVPFKVCYNICNQDGCNTSNREAPTASLIVLSSVGVFFVLNRFTFLKT